jgi:hypothetical protein
LLLMKEETTGELIDQQTRLLTVADVRWIDEQAVRTVVNRIVPQIDDWLLTWWNRFF